MGEPRCLQVDCRSPHCGRPVGAPCINVDGSLRASPHIVRQKRYSALVETVDLGSLQVDFVPQQALQAAQYPTGRTPR